MLGKLMQAAVAAQNGEQVDIDLLIDISELTIEELDTLLRVVAIADKWSARVTPKILFE